MKNRLFVLAVTAVTYLSLVVSAHACASFGNQEKCPSEFIR